MKQIIIVKPGSLSDESIKIIENAGGIVIQHEKPNEVRVMNFFETDVEADDVYRAAIKAIHETGFDSIRTDFAKNLLVSIKK